MATPTPTIPTFTDGTVVHATDLNALASNLTNLYNYNQASFTSQRPVVIAKDTSGFAATGTNAAVTFQTAAVNTDNMWTASLPTQITVQHAGIYYMWATTMWPLITTGGFGVHGISYICVNGTNSTTNGVTSSGNILATGAGNSAASMSCVVNLAAGATIFLVVNSQAGSLNLTTAYGGTTLGAMYMAPST